MAKNQEKDVTTNHYKLIAKLRGHKNSDPPSICYIPQSNCLVSAEKSFETQDIKQQQVVEDDGENQVDDRKQPAYDRFSTKDKTDKKCEILIWNIQKDMIELFSINPPWNIAACRRFIAHDDSIVDICYLTKS